MSREVIKLLQAHRSIRKFTDQPVSRSLLEDIVKAGQQAATSSFVQASSLVRVTDRSKRDRLVELTGNQSYVGTAPEFLVCCADLYRLRQLARNEGLVDDMGFAEQFIIATVDTSLMAQNMVIAAESAGLGICYIGGIRNQPQAVSELLDLPDMVYPVFGLCLGYPAQDPETKPRLPLPCVLMENTYDHDSVAQHLPDYDQRVSDYYASRTGGRKDSNWSGPAAVWAAREARPHMLTFLQRRGFILR